MTIEILHVARVQAIADFKGIGEPLIVLPVEGVFVHERADGTKRLSITAVEFIKLAEAFVEGHAPEFAVERASADHSGSAG